MRKIELQCYQERDGLAKLSAQPTHSQFLHVYWIPGNHLNNSADLKLSDQIPFHTYHKRQSQISQRASM
jgi:hypothetical protein